MNTLPVSSGNAPVISRSAVNRVLVASVVGTAIEWYDFFLYATASALVFAKLFFPSFDPVVGTIAAFGSFAVGYLARPFGAVFFGHFGDRIGRKATLVATLTIMGVGTFVIGLLPTYASIGVWAPIAAGGDAFPARARRRRRMGRRGADGGRNGASQRSVASSAHSRNWACRSG